MSYHQARRIPWLFETPPFIGLFSPLFGKNTLCQEEDFFIAFGIRPFLRFEARC